MGETRTTTTVSAPRESARRSQLVSEVQALVGGAASRSQIDAVIGALEQRRDPLVDETQPEAPLAGLIERLGDSSFPVTISGDEATSGGSLKLGQTFATDLIRWIQRGGYRIIRAG